MTTTQIYTAVGPDDSCGRRARVLWCVEPGQSGFVVRFSSINGALVMRDDAYVEAATDMPRVAAKAAAREEAIAIAEAYVAGAPSNTERMVYLMEYSNAGPLIQAFVLQAVSSFADRVIAAGPEKVDVPMVAGEAWVRCAQDVKARLAW